MIDPASSNVLGTLGINGKLFVAQLINVSIVLLVMWKWVYTPLVRLMDARSKEITDGLLHAKAAEQKLADATVEKDSILHEARAEAHAMLEEARTRSDALQQERMRQARREIERIVEETKQAIQQEQRQAFDALQSEVVALVTLVTQKVAGKMDEKTQRALIHDAIRDVRKAEYDPVFS